MQIESLQKNTVEWIKNLIKTPSFSREEDQTANYIQSIFKQYNIPTQRVKNNIYAQNKYFSTQKKTILLNSHHDTVHPGNWKYNPFDATVEGDKLIGLGSNDAGASVVSLIATFIYYYEKEIPFNLICGISAEEEVSGINGVRLLLPELGKIDLGIVGEPTQMDVAIAEKGLMVADVECHGKTGHAARNEGVNALYLAIDDINWVRSYSFEKVSDLLGKTKMTVSQIEAGKMHNVIPDLCRYVIDIRTNEFYTNQEVAQILEKNLNGKLTPRSYHLNSSRINPEHPIVKKAIDLGAKTYGSPTLSDQSVMGFETIKMGPGDSARSHTPDEYIYISEIYNGVEKYIQLLKGLAF